MAALFWIPITRIKEQKAELPSEVKGKWVKKIRTLKILKYLQYFIFTWWGCNHSANSKTAVCLLRFPTLSLSKQDWPELTVNVLKNGMISEKSSNDSPTEGQCNAQELYKLKALKMQITRAGTATDILACVLPCRCTMSSVTCGQRLRETLRGHWEGQRAWEAKLGEPLKICPPSLFFL